jgi:hypothetical protein
MGRFVSFLLVFIIGALVGAGGLYALTELTTPLYRATAVVDPATPLPGGTLRPLLYRQPVEAFWNDWHAQRAGGGEASQVDVLITGLGKTADFTGVLSFNCEPGGGQFWKAAGNFGKPVLGAEGELLEPVVPTQVLEKARGLFC